MSVREKLTTSMKIDGSYPHKTEENALLQAKVEARMIPAIYMTTKGEIWEYFLDKNGQDRRAAASEAARELSGQSSGKEYKNARRNFELRKGQLSGAKAGDTAKWREFGKTLPPISEKRPPENGFKITFTGQVRISGGRKDKKGRQRGNGWVRVKFTVEITDPDFASNPTYGPLFEDYFENFEENPVTDFSVESLKVEAV